MKKAIGIFGIFALLCLSFATIGNRAEAQRSGGGSGGGASRAGARSLIFDNCPALNGRIPSGSGNETITSYQTTDSLNMKLSNIDLPDNSELTVTVLAKDWLTGAALAPTVAGKVTLLARKGAFIGVVFLSANFRILPVVTSIVITDENGAFIMSGHP